MEWCKFYYITFILIFSSNIYTQTNSEVQYHEGAIIRGDIREKVIYLVFTGHEYADGAPSIISTLEKENVKASFFFTGDFYRNPDFANDIKTLVHQGHYLGAHSDKHLLYCDWTKRDSLLVNRQEFTKDLKDNYKEMSKFGITKEDAPFFLPPYEWYNDSISQWTKELDLQLVNYTAGTISHADYTTPEMSNYRNNDIIYRSIIDYEQESKNGLNGFILLVHFGVNPARSEKFYLELPRLIQYLKAKGYQFKKIDQIKE